MSFVTDYPAAAPEIAAAHFLQRLCLETDCDDVHSAMKDEDMDFVLLHVVGSPGGLRSSPYSWRFAFAPSRYVA